MATFEPEKLSIKPEDADRLFRKVLDARERAHDQQYVDWSALLQAYKTGRVEAGPPGLRVLATAVESTLTFIANQDPSFYCQKRRPGEEEGRKARISESALNYEWAEGRCGPEAYKAAMDALICGAGFVRMGYDPSGMFVPIADYEVDHDEPAGADDPDIRLLTDLLEDAGLPVDHPQAHPYVQRVSPWNVVLPSGYEEIRNMPWVAIRHLLHIDDVRGDSRFKNAKGLQANRTLQDDKVERKSPWPGYSLTTQGEPEHVEVWEIWYHTRVKRMIRDGTGRRRAKMVRETRTLWLTEAPEEDAGKETPIVLAHKLSYLDMGGYPVEEIRFSYTPNSFYGPSMVERMLPVAKDVQMMWDAATAGIERSLALKTLVKKGVLDSTARKKLASSNPEVVEVQSRNLAADVRNLNIPAFPQEMAFIMNMARAFVAEMGGGDEAMRGSRSSAGTATEVAYRAQVTEATSGSKLASFENFLSRVAQKVLKLMQQFYDAPRWIQITGDEEAEFVQYTREEIRGDLSVGVHAGSTKPTGPETERAALIGFMGAVGQIIETMSAIGAQPDVIAEFIEKAMRLWDQDSPALMDAFAEIAESGMKAAAAGPPPPEAVGQGAAASPVTGEPLTNPATPAAGPALANLGGGMA